MAASDVTKRFSDRVENYVKYRPGYPREAVEYLRSSAGLDAGWAVADIGSGTGIFSRLLLERGCKVYGVEPNDEMRAAGEKELAAFANFRSVAGTAENTGLPDRSVDLVTAAQAFHWFEPPAAKREFRRILKTEDGIVCFLWNDRKTDTTPFLREYEAFLHEYGTDYARVNHKNISDNEAVADFFDRDFHKAEFFNCQDFDHEGLRGRLLSSSYVPNEGHERYRPMLAALRRLFDRHQRDGRVRIEYATQIFWGRI